MVKGIRYKKFDLRRICFEKSKYPTITKAYRMMNNNNNTESMVSQCFMTHLTRVVRDIYAEIAEYPEGEVAVPENQEVVRNRVITAFRNAERVPGPYGYETADTAFLTRNDLTEDDEEHIYNIAQSMVEQEEDNNNIQN